MWNVRRLGYFICPDVFCSFPFSPPKSIPAVNPSYTWVFVPGKKVFIILKVAFSSEGKESYSVLCVLVCCCWVFTWRLTTAVSSPYPLLTDGIFGLSDSRSEPDPPFASCLPFSSPYYFLVCWQFSFGPWCFVHGLLLCSYFTLQAMNPFPVCRNHCLAGSIQISSAPFVNLSRCRKAFWQNWAPLHDKNP